MAGLFENVLGGTVGLAGALDQIDRTEGIGELAMHGADQLMGEVVDQNTFQPFSVASGTGNVSVGGDGSINAALSDQYQGITDSALGASQSLFDQAALDPASRQNDIFQQIMATLRPEQERTDQALRDQLFASGRSGISTQAYGGTPEQLANAKAREEAMLNAYLQSQGMAFNEQGQQGQLASQFLQSGMQPEQGLFNQLNPALNAANLGLTGQIAGGNAMQELGGAGLQALVRSQDSANALYGNLFNTASNAAGSLGGMVDSTEWGQKAGDYVSDLFSNLF